MKSDGNVIFNFCNLRLSCDERQRCSIACFWAVLRVELIKNLQKNISKKSTNKTPQTWIEWNYSDAETDLQKLRQPLQREVHPVPPPLLYKRCRLLLKLYESSNEYWQASASHCNVYRRTWKWRKISEKVCVKLRHCIPILSNRLALLLHSSNASLALFCYPLVWYQRFQYHPLCHAY